MTDENDGAATTSGADSDLKAPAAKEPKSPRRKKTAAESPRSGSKAVSGKSATAKVRKHTEQEKLEKLETIEKEVSQGGRTLKAAVKTAGISEQTYYNWRQTAKPIEHDDGQSLSSGDELADLVRLEEENKKLRKRLAEKLRAENAELRRRLGLN